MLQNSEFSDLLSISDSFRLLYHLKKWSNYNSKQALNNWLVLIFTQQRLTSLKFHFHSQPKTSRHQFLQRKTLIMNLICKLKRATWLYVLNLAQWCLWYALLLQTQLTSVALSAVPFNSNIKNITLHQTIPKY